MANENLKEILNKMEAGTEVATQKSDIVIFSTDDGAIKLQTKLFAGSVWLTQKQISDLYGVRSNTVSHHLKGIFENNELKLEHCCRHFRLFNQEGGRSVARDIIHYNLDAIIHVGYRIQSNIGNMFRAWATERLKEFMIKGFTLDDERLKDPVYGTDSYYEELLARIRDIRTSEKRFYQKVRDLIKETSIDYNFRKEENLIKDFFATIQNKMIYATTGHTAAEIIMQRANADKPNMGLTTYSGKRVRAGDITISKNYLFSSELEQLNELVQMFILFAEDRAKNHKLTKLEDWMIETDGFLRFYGREVLQGKGHRSNKQMEQFVKEVYQRYCNICQQNELKVAESQYEAELYSILDKSIKSDGSN